MLLLQSNPYLHQQKLTKNCRATHIYVRKELPRKKLLFQTMQGVLSREQAMLLPAVLTVFILPTHSQIYVDVLQCRVPPTTLVIADILQKSSYLKNNKQITKQKKNKKKRKKNKKEQKREFYLGTWQVEPFTELSAIVFWRPCNPTHNLNLFIAKLVISIFLSRTERLGACH